MEVQRGSQDLGAAIPQTIKNNVFKLLLQHRQGIGLGEMEEKYWELLALNLKKMGLTSEAFVKRIIDEARLEFPEKERQLLEDLSPSNLRSAPAHNIISCAFHEKNEPDIVGTLKDMFGLAGTVVKVTETPKPAARHK
jgi:hypothetical protein